jgi:hypothetical protein
MRAVKEAGYSGARTVRMLATRPDFDPFEMPTTVQIFPHTRSTYFRNVARARKFEGLQVYVTQLAMLGNWIELGKSLFDSVQRTGGIWHLYGHSWEIDALGLWDGLRAILDYVCCREGTVYLTNSEVLKFMQARAKVGQPDTPVSCI